jgi:hypothetical protein
MRVLEKRNPGSSDVLGRNAVAGVVRYGESIRLRAETINSTGLFLDGMFWRACLAEPFPTPGVTGRISN